MIIKGNEHPEERYSKALPVRRYGMSETEYGEYYVVSGGGGNDFIIMTCKQCGAAIILDALDDGPSIHTRWHQTDETNQGTDDAD